MNPPHLPPASLAVLAALLVLAGCAAQPPKPVESSANESRAIGDAAAAAANRALAGPGASGQPTAPGARPALAPAAVAAAAAAQAASQAAQGQRSFAEVTRDATEQAGLFSLWTRDDRVWIEIAPDQFDKPFFLTSNLNRGIGERWLFGGMMASPVGVSQVVQFRKVGTLVQLVAKNVRYTATPGTPEARAVAQGFSDSLLASTAIASQPHPERKSVLIDASALFITDLPGAAIALDRAYRQPYSLDARNSSFSATRSTADMATFEVNLHFALARPVAPSPAPAILGGPSLPSTLPDVRSLFLGFHYTLASLPAVPMRTRAADERVGYFTTERLDFTTDIAREPIDRYVVRWRLEKQDPSADRSPPKQPIVFWLDRTIPERYRAPIREGILEWNKAFERIGYVDAIKVELQPEDADFDTSDIRHASVRWQTVARTAYGAMGPVAIDPRTGEILDADIAIDANNVRVIRNLRAEYLPRNPQASGTAPTAAAACTYDDIATGEAVFGLALLEARGDLVPDGPEVEAFVASFLKDTTMHEVGHALGLRHNLRASTIYTETQLADPAFTHEHGISGSVMEYNPWNIALAGHAQGAFQMSTLGPYDYWAIEYAYREFAPDQEAAGLATIAARSREPLLAYATDEDASFLSLDPQVNRLDLGDSPLGYAHKRFALMRELLVRTEKRELAPGESYSILRRNFSRSLAEASQGAMYAAKYIGGLTTLRDRAGSGRDPLTPVAVEKQREALALVATEVFSSQSFNFSPAFMRRLSVSPFDIEDARELGRAVPPVDMSVDQQILAMQRAVLSHLMGDVVAQRLVNNEAKVERPQDALRLSELYATLHEVIWSELDGASEIPAVRRNLQREHASRLATALVRPAPSMSGDMRALLRADAVRLSQRIEKARKRAWMSAEARAHLEEVQVMVDEALRAPLLRQAV